jgi:hypothetical protein
LLTHTGWHIVGSLKANAKAKTRQRASLYSFPFLPTLKKLNLLKTVLKRMTELKNNLKPLTDKNAQLVTKAICNKGFSGYSSILPRSNFAVGGQESSPQSLTAYSLDRYLQV